MGLPHPASGGTVSAIVYNQLVMPGKGLKMAPFNVLTGQTLLMGSVMGVVTASGKMKLSASAAVDGSQTPVAVMYEDLDTTAGDKVFQLIVEGYLNETALVFGAGHDADSVRHALRAQGIYLTAPRFGSE